MSNSYIIGIDGGGTKTHGVLFDLKGNIIKSVIKGPSNISVEEHEALMNIHAVINELIEDISHEQLKFIQLGIAGVGKIKNKSQIINTMKQAYQTDVDLLTDAHIALNAIDRDQGQAAMLILSGTGSTIMITDGINTHMVGGYGHLLGDEGSAYHIVIQALKNIITHQETGTQLTTFEKKLLNEVDAHNVQEIKSFVYEHQKSDIAKVAVFISDKANEGYEQAKELLIKEGIMLGEQGVNAYRLLASQPEVIIAFRGGFIEKAPYVREACIKHFLKHIPTYQVAPHPKDPIYGAFHLAISHLRGRNL